MIVGVAVGVMRMTFPSLPVQRLPSGPTVMWFELPIVSAVNFVTVVGLAVEKRPTKLVPVTHMFPSGPAVIPCTPLMSGLSIGVTVPSGATFAKSGPTFCSSVTHTLPSGPSAGGFWVGLSGRLKVPVTLGAA